MIEEGGDWDRRNRLKVYEACHLMSIRNFKGAALLFLDALPTFTCTEVITLSPCFPPFPFLLKDPPL